MVSPILLQTKVGNIEISPFDLCDVEAQLAYLFDSPRDYLESIGFDPTKFQTRELVRERISGRYSNQTESIPTSMAARLNGRTVAAVFLHVLPKPRAHFHIFDPSLRGQGLGKSIFCAALKVLMHAHELKTVWIEPKHDNNRMNALMKKCGFVDEGNSIFEGPVTQKFKARKYRADLERL
jgi:RimJ/RimL family protein N-acetyltransferase